MTAIRLLVLFLALALPARAVLNDGVVSFSDSQLKGSQDFWRGHDIPSHLSERVASISVERIRSEDWLKRSAVDYERIFAALSLTEVGRATLEKLFRHSEADRLRIAPLKTLREKAAGRVDPSIVAFYSDSVIYLGENHSLLSIATMLVHEAQHADDAAEKRSTENANAAVVASEHRAYRMQDRYLDELVTLDTRFRNVITIAVEHRYLIEYPITEAHFVRILSAGYGIPKSSIQDYLKETPFASFP